MNQQADAYAVLQALRKIVIIPQGVEREYRVRQLAESAALHRLALRDERVSQTLLDREIAT